MEAALFISVSSLILSLVGYFRVKKAIRKANLFLQERPDSNEVEVIAVDHTKDDVLVSHRRWGSYASGGKEELKGKGTCTVVLYTVDGKLRTKWFDGKWTLEQVKNWKELE